MTIVPKSEFDSLVFLHSENIQVEEGAAGVLRLSFGPTQVSLAEDAARDFLYELAAHFARKDLADYDEATDAELAESRDALSTLSLLRSPTT